LRAFCRVFTTCFVFMHFEFSYMNQGSFWKLISLHTNLSTKCVQKLFPCAQGRAPVWSQHRFCTGCCRKKSALIAFHDAIHRLPRFYAL
jgi:hypothetical protein